MARALRLDSSGATWHLFSRGNNYQDIFLCDADRLRFLELLGHAVERYKWVVHEYELMTNHYHLVIDTPEPTLSRGMQWLNGTYVQWLNKTHDRVGHLFQGRFKGTLVEAFVPLTLGSSAICTPLTRLCAAHGFSRDRPLPRGEGEPRGCAVCAFVAIT